MLWIYLAICAIVLTFIGVRLFLPVWWRLRDYAEACSRCGALPPPPTPRALRFLKGLSRLLLFVQAGRVRIVGIENAQVPGPRVITPNHGHSVDPAPFAVAFDEPLRYMAARGVFRALGGLGAMFAGPTGAFPADLTPGKGGPARDAAVRLLVSGQSLVMFPEGWAYMDGVMGPFKKGAVRIAREAAQILGSPTYLIPVYMRYGRYPGSWIRRFPPPVQYALVLLLFPLYRRGLTVVFGKAICSTDLPADDAEATERLREAVIALDPSKN